MLELRFREFHLIFCEEKRHSREEGRTSAHAISRFDNVFERKEVNGMTEVFLTLLTLSIALPQAIESVLNVYDRLTVKHQQRSK